jgi:phosphopantothenoylcysteine decarboxylase / phosphopantothenate---cysteine ligase
MNLTTASVSALDGKRIVLAISGSIAAYKGADIASRLTQAGASVDAVLTPAATQFITPLAIRSLTRRPVFVSMFDPESELAEEHVELARSADAILLAPATATTIARLAHGLADDVVSLTALASTAPVLIAPAMDSQMWANAATQANIATLRARGVAVVGPAAGRLASGRVGEGRLETTETILAALSALLGAGGDLAGFRLLVTAGGTQEPIDPVRYVGNHSSGKMGYAIAEAARDRGADVELIATATALADPYGVRVTLVRTAEEMRHAVLESSRTAHALIMAAAVADFRPKVAAAQKIKKGGRSLTLDLVPTTDILGELQQGGFDLVRVGFAAESEDLIANAGAKLRAKGLDLIAANDITLSDSGFGADNNRVTIIDRAGRKEELPLLPKYRVAHLLLDRLLPLLLNRAPVPSSV